MSCEVPVWMRDGSRRAVDADPARRVLVAAAGHGLRDRDGPRAGHARVLPTGGDLTRPVAGDGRSVDRRGRRGVRPHRRLGQIGPGSGGAGPRTAGRSTPRARTAMPVPPPRPRRFHPPRRRGPGPPWPHVAAADPRSPCPRTVLMPSASPFRAPRSEMAGSAAFHGSQWSATR